MKKMIHLGAFFWGSGFHPAAWRLASVPGGNFNIDEIKRAAQAAERGKFDAIFLADEFSFQKGNGSYRSEVIRYEPLTLLSYLAACTNRIGLVATGSTTYEEPYHIARRFSSLDHLSGGRAGWNVVTSSHSADQHFGPSRYEAHDQRYVRASEFIAVTKGFWDVWGEDTFLRDSENGVFYDASSEIPFLYKGDYFEVSGPVNFPRPIQGHPVIFQAGASAAGKDFGARHGEVIFVTGQPDIEKAKDFYRETKNNVVAAGRAENDIAILPGFAPVVGRTQSEAEDKLDQLTRMLHRDVGLDILSSLNGGFDFTKFDVDGPVPNVPITDGNQTRQRAALDVAGREGLSIRQLYERFAGGVHKVIGTPVTIADRIQEWFEADAVDGFNINFQGGADSVEDFVDLVVPELQRRGIYRMDYSGNTLRDHFNFKVPVRRPAVPTGDNKHVKS